MSAALSRGPPPKLLPSCVPKSNPLEVPNARCVVEDRASGWGQSLSHIPGESNAIAWTVGRNHTTLREALRLFCCAPTRKLEAESMRCSANLFLLSFTFLGILSTSADACVWRAPRY